MDICEGCRLQPPYCSRCLRYDRIVFSVFMSVWLSPLVAALVLWITS